MRAFSSSTRSTSTAKDRWNFYRQFQGPLARLDWDPYALENDLPEDEDDPRDERLAYSVHLAPAMLWCPRRQAALYSSRLYAVEEVTNHIRTLQFYIPNSLATVYSQYD
ncbi:hypothetical protein CMUS01_16785 [Colletotrichum musicola]|uniref:Uncharacterized protein n=1 Tax=Colletotrichum musicola TaxID=2175873 RepID=A0A8H6IL81_9PEZI|nr:hypothetical protein CMUS01_16785 [Colletotrichum musicola]